MSRSFTVGVDAFNAYVNWVLPAIAGVMPAADAILREHRDQVVEVAAMLREMLGLEPKRLYRGILLEPEQSARGILDPDPALPFLSWTEDRDVACWFADPRSFASGDIQATKPAIEGFLVEHLPEPSQILFHHAWAHRFPLPGGRLGRLSQLAELHELIDIRELDWSLETQAEVITIPITSPLVLLERPASPDTHTLDARLTFPAHAET